MPDSRIPPGWRYDASNAATAEVIRAAVGEIGVTEDPPGSNRGEKIDRWLLVCGVEPPAFWCAAFASAMLRASGQDTPLIASAHGWIAWGEKHGRIVADGDPVMPGDLWCALHHPDVDGDQHGHVSIVVSVGEFLATVGGNEKQSVRAWWRKREGASAIVRVLP